MDLPIYMDGHATTRVDPRVVEAMLPFFGEVTSSPETSEPYLWDGTLVAR